MGNAKSQNAFLDSPKMMIKNATSAKFLLFISAEAATSVKYEMKSRSTKDIRVNIIFVMFSLLLSWLLTLVKKCCKVVP